VSGEPFSSRPLRAEAICASFISFVPRERADP
jgi:hypothetical protein